MKYINNGYQSNLLSTDDITVVKSYQINSESTNLSDVLAKHDNDITDLKKYTKWLYKYGGTGSKGGGGDDPSTTKWSAEVLCNGQKITSDNQVIILGEDTTTITISGYVTKGGDSSYKVNISPIMGTEYNEIKRNPQLSFSYSYKVNGNQNFAVKIYSQADDVTKTFTFSCISNPYDINLYFCYDNNLSDKKGNNGDIFIEHINGNLKLLIDYSIIGRYAIPFEIISSSLNLINQNNSSDKITGYINENLDGNGTYEIQVDTQNITIDNCGYHSVTIKFKIPASETTSAFTLIKTIGINIIPGDRIFIKVTPANSNALIYKKNNDSDISNATTVFNEFKRLYTIYQNAITENASENDIAAAKAIVDDYELNNNMYVFDIGSTSFKLMVYNGITNTSATYAINASVDNNVVFTKNIKERQEQQISIPINTEGVHEIKFYAANQSETDIITYYIYAYSKQVSLDWYDNNIQNAKYNFYRAGLIDNNVNSAFSKYNNLQHIQLYANNDTDKILYNLNESHLPTYVYDNCVSFGIQYSNINNVDNKLISLKTNNTSDLDITIYQNKVVINQKEIPIYIPKEDNYNLDDNSKYHLLTICKRFVYYTNNMSYYELCVYIDGCLENALDNFITGDVAWTSCYAHPANFGLNLIDASFFNHNKDTNDKRLTDDNQVQQIHYLDDISIAEYYYKFASSFSSVDKVPSLNNIIKILKELRSFSETKYGMIEVSNEDVIKNISKVIDIPVILFRLDETIEYSFINNLSKSYDESSLSKTKFELRNQTGVAYSSGLNELTDVQMPALPNGSTPQSRFYLQLQGSSTGKFFDKNLNLGITQNDNGYMAVYSPNFKYVDFNDNSIDANIKKEARDTYLPEEKFTLKADHVDSSHSNNTAIGKFVNENTTPFKTMEGKTSIPANAVLHNYIKNCLLGFPVLVFVSAYNGDIRHTYYLGIYNFNLGRDSYFNMGYISPTLLEENKLNGIAETVNNEYYVNKLKDNTAGNFIVTYINCGSEDRKSIAIDDTVVVAEIQGGDPHFDFSQYDDSILLPTSNDDSYVMFGDFVPNYDPTQGIGTGKNALIRNHLHRLVENVAKGGGYIFENVLGKHLGPYKDEYHKAINNTIYKSANQVPNYRIQYERYPNLHPLNDEGTGYTAEPLFNVKTVDYTYDDNGVSKTIRIPSSLPRPTEDQGFNYLKDLLTTTEQTEGQEYKTPILDYISTAEYYTTCMAFGLVDSVMKNLNVKTWTADSLNGNQTINDLKGGKWYVAFYDMDTSLGRDNTGDKVSFFAFSDYWYTESNSLSPATIYRDFFPKNTSTETITITGFDIPSSYLFAIAKYTQLSPIWNNLCENNGNAEKSTPQNIWARWRSLKTSNISDYLGTLGIGELASADNFIDNYFIRNLDNIPEQLYTLNYRYKYLKRIKVNNGMYDEDTSSGSFESINKKPFHGKGVNELKEWLNGRLHILDAYFNLDFNNTNVLRLKYTGEKSVYNYNVSNPNDDNNDFIKIIDNVAATQAGKTIYEWVDKGKPSMDDGGEYEWTSTGLSDPKPTIINHDQQTNYLASNMLNSNKDIVILKDIFTSEGTGKSYQSATINLSLKSQKYSPIVVSTANGSSIKYLITDPNNLYTLLADTTGAQVTTFGGSPLWTYLGDVSTMLVGENPEIYINSDLLETFTATRGKCSTWTLVMKALKTVSITKGTTENDQSTEFGGVLRFINSNEEDNYPNLTSINLSRTKISLYVDGEGVNNINLQGINSESIDVLNCKNLINVNLSNAKIQKCTFMPGWSNDITLSNSKIKELSISPKDENDASIRIVNDSELETLRLGGFKYVHIEQCSKLKSITFDNPKLVETLEIIRCNTSDRDDTELKIYNANRDLLINDKVFDLNAFTNLKNISFESTLGFNIIDMHNLQGFIYETTEPYKQYKCIKLLSNAFANTHVYQIITEVPPEIDENEQSEQNDNAPLWLMIGTSPGSSATATFANSYIWQDGYDLQLSTYNNKILIPKNITNVSSLFANGLYQRTGGINISKAQVILGNNTNSSNLKCVFEDKSSIIDMSSMFMGQNITCTNYVGCEQLSLAEFSNAKNVSSIFAQCNFQYISKLLFEREINGVIRTLSSNVNSSDNINIDAFATAIDKFEMGAFNPIINKISSFSFGSNWSISLNRIFNDSHELISHDLETNKVKDDYTFNMIDLFGNINSTNKISTIQGVSINESMKVNWSGLFYFVDKTPRFPQLKTIIGSFNHSNNLSNTSDESSLPINNINVNEIGFEYLANKSMLFCQNSFNMTNINDPVDFEKVKEFTFTSNTFNFYKTCTDTELIDIIKYYNNDTDKISLDYVFKKLILVYENNDENVKYYELKLTDNTISSPYNFTSMNHTFESVICRKNTIDGDKLPLLISQNSLKYFTNVTSWESTFENDTLYNNLPLNMFNLYNGPIQEPEYKYTNYSRIISSMKNMFKNVKVINQTWFAHENYADICEDDQIKADYNKPLNGSYHSTINTYNDVLLENEHPIDSELIENTDNKEYGKHIINHLILPFDIFYGCSGGCDVEGCFNNAQFEGILPDKLLKDTSLDTWTSANFVDTFKNLFIIPNYVGKYKFKVLKENLTNGIVEYGEPIVLPTYVFVPSYFTSCTNLNKMFNFKIILPYSKNNNDNTLVKEAYAIFMYNSLGTYTDNTFSNKIGNIRSIEYGLPGEDQSLLFKNIISTVNTGDRPSFDPYSYYNVMYFMMLPDTSNLKEITGSAGNNQNLVYKSHTEANDTVDGVGLDRQDLGFTFINGASFKTAIERGHIFNEYLLSILYGYMMNVKQSGTYNDEQYDKFDRFNISILSKKEEGGSPFISLNSQPIDPNNNSNRLGLAKFAVMPNYDNGDQYHKYTIEVKNSIVHKVKLVDTFNTIPGNKQAYVETFMINDSQSMFE